MEENQRTNRRYSKQQPVSTDATGKLPPRDTELEQAVLGALMLEKDAYMVVSDILVPDSFYDPAHQKIYAAITALSQAQKPIDMLTVTDQLRQEKVLEEIGGPVYIAQLTSRVMSAANIEYHARIIAQKYLARRLITFSTAIESKAFDESNDIDDLLQEAEGALFEISQTQLKREVTQIDPVLTQAITQIQAASNRESGLSGLPTGFDKLDKLTSGWQNSDLIIVAARPAMGKTAFVLSMAKYMAVDFSIPIAMFSLEMSNVQLVNRLISNVCELPGEKIKSGRLSSIEWDQLNTNIRKLYGAPFFLDETPGLSITELRTKARRLVREHGVKMILIDYLQLMNATGTKFGNREQEVSTISRSLKALAKELNIPIMALSQLSRQNESRDDKRPMLSDLRESGAIEQDADIVCFIHRPEYYTKSSEDAQGNDIRGLAEFIVAKHRSGSTDTVNMRFVHQFAKFENWDDENRRVKTFANGDKGSGKRVPSKHNVSNAPEPTPDAPTPSAPTSGFNPGGPMPDILPGSGNNDVPF
jgi:replicative DNA helicase